VLLGLYLNIRDKAQILGRIYVQKRTAYQRDSNRFFLLFKQGWVLLQLLRWVQINRVKLWRFALMRVIDVNSMLHRVADRDICIDDSRVIARQALSWSQCNLVVATVSPHSIIALRLLLQAPSIQQQCWHVTAAVHTVGVKT